jgi:hypothetical protein
MITNELIERSPLLMPEPFGNRLGEVMATNQRLLATAELAVSGDLRAACRLVGAEDHAEPEPSSAQKRMATYLILFSHQQQLFGKVSANSHPPFTLANATADNLILMQIDPHDETRTTLHITTDGNSVGINKVRVNYFASRGPENAPLDTRDMEVIDHAAARLQRVNRIWRRLIHGPRQG